MPPYNGAAPSGRVAVRHVYPGCRSVSLRLPWATRCCPFRACCHAACLPRVSFRFTPLALGYEVLPLQSALTCVLTCGLTSCGLTLSCVMSAVCYRRKNRNKATAKMRCRQKSVEKITPVVRVFQRKRCYFCTRNVKYAHLLIQRRHLSWKNRPWVYSTASSRVSHLA